MRKTTLTAAACATLLWAGAALAAPSAQQSCDHARITAWKAYVSCVDTVVAKDAKRISFDEFAAFAKCRHAYFKKWAAFQAKASLTKSTCIGNRYTDNGDQTVTDNLSGLVWEKKQNLDSTHNYGDPHDADNSYSWSTVQDVPQDKENGTAFTSFLGTVNGGGGFAGSNGWRLPTLAELQTIMLDFECTGAGGGPTCICPTYPSLPCVDRTLDLFNTQYFDYWSATSWVPFSGGAWLVDFSMGYVGSDGKEGDYYVRAVRGGF